MNKICLIGHGYWGGIIERNLKNLGYVNIQIVDLKLNNMNMITDSFDFYFVATPFKTHFELLKKISKFNNKKIWCEKPLVGSLDETIQIYKEIEKNNNKLFVDWIYLFNPCINHLKSILQKKKLKQIILNRTNNGPVRTDCSSIYDLSSHDISILFYLFDKEKFDFNFSEFSLDKTKKSGSNISWCYVDGVQIIINSSWEHEKKNRVSLFITDNDEIIVFDDVTKIIINDGAVSDFKSHISPIENSINYFFSSENFENNKNLTIKITKTLESNYEY